MTQLPNEKQQQEIIKAVEQAEQKARDMANFSRTLAKKWKQQLTQSD
jgi:hypothetical protein